MNAYDTYRLAIKNGTANPVKKEKKPIAKFSEKRVKEQKEYIKIVKEFMKVSDKCEIAAPGCQKKASGLHHKQKRSPKNFLLKENLLRACSSCQLWIELHPLESIEMGFSISKHKRKVA